jgi:hypothetical protein
VPFKPAAEQRIADTVLRSEKQVRNVRSRRRRRGGNNYFMPKFGKLDGVLNQGSSATMSIWAGDPLADTGDNITVYDWFLGSGESIASGKKVKAEFICGKWYATAAEC